MAKTKTPLDVWRRFVLIVSFCQKTFISKQIREFRSLSVFGGAKRRVETHRNQKKTMNATTARSTLASQTLLILAASVLLLTGCSSRPSTTDGRAALEQKIQRESNGFIRLVSFQKTDGVEQEMMGMKVYQMKYTATIEFTDNCYWGDGNGMIGWQGGFYADRPIGGGATASLLNTSTHYKAGGKGQQEQVSGALTFQKSENGWALAQ